MASANQTSVSVEAHIDDMTQTLSQLQRTSIPKATRQGLNRAIKSVRGLATKSISLDTGIKQSEVRSEMEVALASPNQSAPMAKLTARKRPRARNLIDFIAPARRRPSDGRGKPQFFRRREKTRRRKGGVRRSVAGDYRWQGVEAKAWRNPKTYRGTFVVRFGSGAVRVVRREGSSRRGKLKLVAGPSVKASMIQPQIDRQMRKHGAARFVVEYERALTADLRRRGLA